jgi:hypothetical protein
MENLPNIKNYLIFYKKMIYICSNSNHLMRLKRKYQFTKIRQDNFRNNF